MAASLLVAGLALGGCGPGGGLAPGQGEAAPVATAMSSLSAGVALALAQLRAVSPVPLEFPQVAYRPSEPASLMDVPRAVVRARLMDAGQGYVVVYQLPDVRTAMERAAELARHVGSGFGQTNFPADARFHVAWLGDTVVFGWWSPALASSDREGAEAFFAALQGVGTEVPVVK